MTFNPMKEAGVIIEDMEMFPKDGKWFVSEIEETEFINKISQALTKACAKGVKTERERCAKVAESDNYKMFMKKDDIENHELYSKVRKQMRREIAQAIRNLPRG